MNATPVISTAVKDCTHLSIEDKTVTTEFYGRVYFLTAEGSTITRYSYTAMYSKVAQLPIIKDGTHTAYMVCIDKWAQGSYNAGDVVLSPVIAPDDDDLGRGFNINKIWKANKNTSEEIYGDPVDWDVLPENATSFNQIIEAGNVKIATQQEVVDCKVFQVVRKDCNVIQLTRNDDINYSIRLYKIKNYLSAEVSVELPGAWSDNKMVIDLSALFASPTNIYVVEMFDPDDVNTKVTLVVYNLCQIHECMSRLIQDVLCKECKDCTPSKEELFKRITLNKMIAIYTALILNIHYAEFIYLGEDNLTESRYKAVYDSVQKLDSLLLLMDDCGECKDVYNNCSSC